MPLPIVSVEHLSKRYVIAHKQDSRDGLRHVLENALRNPFQTFRQRNSPSSQEEFWALKDVSFDLEQGEVVGIIGRNGAGKSTLLKVLSRITEPTSGRIRLRGRVASLLEVGTGFHPDLTGRENIYLNGAILGMSRVEIRSKFDEIVAFSEVEKYLDTPVKRYSSGMYVRLAFAVAAHLEPEILIVDEVLAVGDIAFQKKCLGKMEDISKSGGRTVLFVSHNMAMITRLCGKAVLLQNGSVAMIDSAEAVVSQYVLSFGETGSEKVWAETDRPGNNKMRLRAVRVVDGEGRLVSAVDIRRRVWIELHYEALEELPPRVRTGLRLFMPDGTVVLSSADTANTQWREKPRQAGQYVSRCEIPGDLLNEGVYSVTVAADIPFVETIFFQENVVSFQVEQTGGVGGEHAEKWLGVVCPSLNWEIEFSDQARPAPILRPY
jgi:lipopolysaccharide transport system ATP-binding protein